MDKSIRDILSDFIGARYERWLDFSRYHCSKNGLEGEEEDVLMKVIEDLWQKDFSKLYGLYKQKTKDGTGLDFYVLKMLRIYIKMPKAPYRWKYHTRKLDFVDEAKFDSYDIVEPDIHEKELDETMEAIQNLIYCNHFSLPVIRILEWILVKGNKDFSNFPAAKNPEMIEKTYEKALLVLKNKYLGEKKDPDGQLSIF